MMDQAQLKAKIESDLYPELRWLLCAATEWHAQRELVDEEKVKQPCFHLKLYAMDSVFLHARSLYEFFTAPPNRREERFTWQDFGPGQTSALYTKLKKSLHGRVMHMDRDRSKYEPIKDEVVNFANDILGLWSNFSEKPGMEPYKSVLDQCLQNAIVEAQKVAEQEEYKKHGFKSPFTWPLP